MAATGVGESRPKTRVHTDVSSQTLSPSSGKDRREAISLPPVKKLSPDKVLSAKTAALPNANLIEEQTSFSDAPKQNATVFREQVSDPFSNVNHLSFQQVSSSSGVCDSGTSNVKNLIAFQGSATSENVFAFPKIRTGKSGLASASSSANMVAVTVAACQLRPVLCKSHSVAYGVDSTVSSPPTPIPFLQQHLNQTMANGGEQVPQLHQGNLTEVIPPPVNQLPLFSSSSSSPSLSSMAERPSDQHPHPSGLSRVLAENVDLPHQGSLGFNVPYPRRLPLQRSESLQSDSQTAKDSGLVLHSPERDLSAGGTSPGRQSRMGGPHRTGKWRSSSSARRSSSRNQPLSRSNSRNALVLPPSGATQQNIRSQSEGRVNHLPSSPARGFPQARNLAEDVAGSEDLPSDVLEDGEDMSSQLASEVFHPDNISEDRSPHSPKQHTRNKNDNLAGIEKTHSQAFFGGGVVRSNTEEAMQSDIITDTDLTVEMKTTDSSQIAPSSQTHSPPLRRQLSRRRSYRQATADPSTPNTASSADDDKKSDDDGDDVVADGGERGVTVEDVSEEEEEDSPPSFTPPGSPRPAKSRRVDMSSFDPYQIFEVQHLPCIILTVKVLQGRNITNGWAQDLVDTPDPYIKLRIKTAPEGRQRTKTIANNANPVWNEKFTFFLGFSENNVLEVTLMEENPLMDQETGTIYFNVHDRMREFGKWQTEIFNFNGVSEVDVAFHMEWDQNPTLRYSLCLSALEKEFMRKRKQKVRQALNALLGEQGPKTLEETPTIAVIGSGGGFRAMTGYSGVFKALADTGILDCATYACGLSGSSWYLSTLYSHERWPEMNPGELQRELMTNIDKSLVRLLGPQSLYRYVRSVVSKRREGQPVSFTDFFGHMVGETLLKGRLNCRLTDQREKIEEANVPMPLYTCVHVKKDVPARSFQEWVEFSPYEIGMPKYGTFMDSKYFGSKFYMGKLVKSYEEPPLHFLQGIWGSAFCILFKRLLENNRNLDPAEMIRREMEMRADLSSQIQDDDNESSDISDDDDDADDETDDTDEEMTNGTRRRSSTSLVPASFKKAGTPTDSSDRDTSDGESSGSEVLPPKSFMTRQDSSEGFEDVDASSPEPPSPSRMEMSSPRPIRRTSSPAGVLSSSPEGPKKGVRFSHQVDQFEKRKAQQQGRKMERKPLLKRASTVRRGKSRSYWSSILRGIFESQSCELLSTRAGRAAVIHNFMRGLNLQQTYPLSPFTPLSQRVQEGDEFDGIFDLHPTHIKHIYMVDAGLTFNSPYPLVLRPQRGVDVILSFDFSARDSDRTPPFKELLLAEKWAKLNRLPFPPIDPGVVDREGLKELYIFQDPDNPHCPVVLHFPLVNINFRHYKAPGVPRETKAEEDFADFDIFDDPTAPFSTFNFTYTAQNFQRLSKLTEFNTLHSLDQIKAVLAEVIARKREASPRVPIHTRDFKLLRMKSVQERRELKKFLKKMESRSSVKTPTPTSSQPPTPFFTPCPRDSARERNPFVFDLKSKSSSSSGSSQEGSNPFFSTSRRSSQTDSTRDSNRSSKSPRRESNRNPRSPRKRSSEVEVRRLTSEEFVSTSSVPYPPSPAPSTDSYDDVFPRSPATPTPTKPSFLRPSSFNDQTKTSSPIGNARQDSSTSLGPLRQSSGLSRGETEEEEEEFHDAPEAFTRDGEGVVDPQQAKMFYEGAKEKRKRLRRQSTISTLNSITESISLDSEDPPSGRFSKTSEASSSGPMGIDVDDLGQFEGIADEDDHGRNADNHETIDDDEDEHWYSGDSFQHRGSVVTLEGQGGS